MSDNRPRPPDRKLGLIAPVSIGLLLVFVLLVAAFWRTGDRPAAPPAPAAAAAITVARPDPTFGRADILRAAATASADYAAGTTPADRPEEPLAGRRFAIRIPFGCSGQRTGSTAPQAYYEFDTARRTLRLVAQPYPWERLPQVQAAITAGDLEAVEGFWVPQPWSNAETCAPQRKDTVSASLSPLPPPTVGLARLFKTGDSRVGRRAERPYEKVIKVTDDTSMPLWLGYRLVLEGRFATFPSGRVAQCWSESPAHRPVCVFAVQLERVAFESASDDRLLAEWRE